jgi:hypothetical protein
MPQLRQKAFRGSGCRHERFSEEQKQDRFSRKSVAEEAARLSTTRPRSATPMHKDSDRVRAVKRLLKKILSHPILSCNSVAHAASGAMIAEPSALPPFSEEHAT